MSWNWESSKWPHFYWNKDKLIRAERLFLENSGINNGSLSHLSQQSQQQLSIDLMSSEAIGTSEIEGEYLNRDSVHSSIKRALGLSVDRVKASPAESGIAEMMVDLQRNLTIPLTENHLFEWHRMLLNGRRDIDNIGTYRTHIEPMQIVSGPDYARKIHFEAPPSKRVPQEMAQLMKWFTNTSSLLRSQDSMGAITRAGIAHLWFESIHPFEDGNGRIGRAIAEKALAEGLSKPTIIVLAKILLKHRKQYYQALSTASKSMDITEWLLWFAAVVIEAEKYTHSIIQFIIEKTKLLDRVRGKLNKRQDKVLIRVLNAGPEGFTGGLSASNYMSITGATIPTTTRDLNDLVEKNVFKKIGERKSTRYHLVIKPLNIDAVAIKDVL